MAEKTITCPHCQQELSIDEQYLGMEVECPTCNKNFTAAERKIAAVPVANAGVKQGTVLNQFMQSENPAVIRAREMKMNAIDEDDPIAENRLILTKFFNKAEAASAVEGIAGVLSSFFEVLEKFMFIFTWISKLMATPGREIVRAFKEIQNLDIPFLENLDILPNYGKNSSQLVADSYTLFSPAIGYETESDGPEFKCAVTEKDDTFLYSLEEVIKIFTFEDQLFVFKAYWDYTCGKLFNESTEAFFFKDISDIQTKNDYEYMYCKINDDIGFWEAVKKHIKLIVFFTLILAGVVGGCIAGATNTDTAIFAFLGGFILIGLLTFFIASAIAYNCEKNKKSKVLTKKSETFIITASSGNSTGITILCDDWVEAKNGTRYIRTDGEKIIHAIRKMIEEKKVSANE